MLRLSLLFSFIAIVLVAVLASAVAVMAARRYDAYPAQAFGTVAMGTSAQSYMFYELQGDPTKTAAERAQLPLLVFASGGPGSSGQFPSLIESVGNKQLIFDPANSSNYLIVDSPHPWTKFANVIFPDSPLGTGWSNAGNQQDYSVTDEGVAANLVLMMEGFLKNHPEFRGSEIALFGESYSGKIVNFFALALLKSGLDLKLIAVSNNDGWVSGIDCMNTYGAFMIANSLANAQQAAYMNSLAADAAQQLAAGAGINATNIWSNQQNFYDEAANGVNVYNIRYFYDYFPENLLANYMNGPFRAALPKDLLIPASKQFGDQGNTLFFMMSNAFMTSGVSQVQQLIDAGVSVNIWSGQLDLIVSTLCTRSWMSSLPWSDLPNFDQALRIPFVLNQSNPDTFNNGFLQEYKNVRFWSLTDSGHCAPVDQPETASYIASYIVANGSADKVDTTPFARAKELSERRKQQVATQRRRRGRGGGI